jgi:hypothetical protein
VAGVGTLHKGFSIEYAWAQVGSAADRRQAGAYYIGAAEGGEPPGRWWGPGAQALGFRDGQEIERKPYDLVFGERVHPADGTRLGRRRTAADKMAEDLYARLLQAEPQATAQRKRELRDEAAREARQSPPYFDLTFSLGKSTSVFHASLGENARRAHEDGDSEAEAFWAGEIAALDEMIYAANEAALAFFQAEAGYTRLGSHAGRVNGRETGQWREAPAQPRRRPRRQQRAVGHRPRPHHLRPAHPRLRRQTHRHRQQPQGDHAHAPALCRPRAIPPDHRRPPLRRCRRLDIGASVRTLGALGAKLDRGLSASASTRASTAVRGTTGE